MYGVRPTESGRYRITQVDPQAFPAEAPPVPIDLAGAEDRVSADSGDAYDLLLLYTGPARRTPAVQRL